MRPIKFRARDLDTGEFVYAELGQVSAELRPEYLTFITDNGIFIVDSTTIAQFVGYDKAGNEVYEGDKILVDNAGEDEFFATCLPVGVNHWGGCFLHGGNFIFNKEFSLKEACQNPWNALQEIDNLTEKHFKEASHNDSQSENA